MVVLMNKEHVQNRRKKVVKYKPPYLVSRCDLCIFKYFMIYLTEIS